MSDHTIEAKLTPDLKADVIFRYTPGVEPFGDDEGWADEIEILHVSPFGVVGPIDEASLNKLADEWLKERGGYEACCRVAEARNRGWE